ncbi:MAG TPA: hypothetical protein VFC84_11670 [Desulfosporosinus sp.]|nr:hypothetical protein [Desulfosporosinus sp.]
MDMNLNAESIKAWERLVKLSDEERKSVLATVQSTLIQSMKLSPKELKLLQNNTLGELKKNSS